jgi:hypothetical protein
VVRPRNASIEFSGEARGPHDHGGPHRQTWAEDGDRGVYFFGVVDAWVRNVTIVDADDAITLEEYDFCQVEHVRLRAERRPEPSGHPGLWATRTVSSPIFASTRNSTMT